MLPELQQARRVLIVRMDNIGDVIMLSPGLRALRAALPAAHVTLLCSPGGAQAAELLRPWIDEVLVRRALWQDASGALPFDPARERALIADLRARRFDAALICTSFSQTPYPAAYACYLAGIPLRAGQSSVFGGGVLTHPVPPLPDGAHQIDRGLHLLGALGLAAEDRELRVSIPTDAHASIAPLLPSRPFIALAPAASCAARTYDIGRFAAAGRALATRGYGVVILGAAREVSACSALATAIPGARSLAGATTIPQLAAVLATSELLLGCHSGPMHIADAVGTPVAIAFAGTDRESEWEPRDVPAVLMRRPTACAPCRGFECDRDLACLDIDADELVTASLALLERRASGEGGAMNRRRILTWHVHGSYLYYLAQGDRNDYFLPTRPGRPSGYGGRNGDFAWPSNVHEVDADEVRRLDIEAVLVQARPHYMVDMHDLLTPTQLRLPRIYLEHDPPRQHPTDTRHPAADDPATLLVHCTHFNALMWDGGRTPTRVIPHGVTVPSGLEYRGGHARGLVIVNGLAERGRRLGLDVFERARNHVPLDLVGMGSEPIGGLGSIPLAELHARAVDYRFVFNPIRYTSLGLAICEAMLLGIPVVGLATTELPTVIASGVSGYVDTDVDRLIEAMLRLLDDPAHARSIGARGREVARARFGITRFLDDWDAAWDHATQISERNSIGPLPARTKGA